MEYDAPVKIAIIGAGLVGPRHAHSVQASPGAELLCLVDPRPDAKAIAETFRVPSFSSIQDMLNQGYHPNAAIVCTPNASHVAVSLELLDSDIHLLVEKPISTDVPSGEKLISIARALNKHLLVGHHRRFNAYVSAAKRTLDNGLIGKTIAVSGIWATYKPDSYFSYPTEWRAKAGTGGPIMINLVHEVDVLQYLFGPIARVYAEKTVSQRGNEAEEGAAILCKFSSGLVGTFILTDASPSMHNFESGTGENLNIPHSGKDFYRILGSKGTLSVGDMQLETFPEGSEKDWSTALRVENVPVGDETPFDEQVANFVNVIRGTELPRCTGEDGLSAVVVCNAVHEAIRTGHAVDIPL